MCARFVRRVGSAEICVPAGHVEEIADHTRTELVQLAAGAGDDDTASAALGGVPPREQLSQHNLCRGAAKVFLRHADLVDLPQAADLSQRGLKDLQIQIADGFTALDCLKGQSACPAPVAAQQLVHVLARQRRQPVLGVEHAGACARHRRQQSKRAFDHCDRRAGHP